ncbi:hypothetical protein [Hydrogenophaga sp. MI9]|uniref:hypothetical protein n=1 Tax=Hydrogenophaga sp. MI9 TaxID=3453719 RepID=UPI003EE93297
MSRSISHHWARHLWAGTLAIALVGCVYSARAATVPAPAAAVGLVTRDKVALRAAPRDSAASQTLLWRGEALEIRGSKGDFLQVWDHHRERGGYVRATQLMRVSTDAAETPQLLALMAFVSEQPGSEPLGLALAAAAIQALPAAALQGPQGAAVMDAIGRQAERLAERASSGTGRTDDPLLTAHLDVARRHGVQLVSREQDGRMTVCYDGDAYRRLLAMPAANAEQKARAAMALTRSECLEAPARAADREALDEGLADLLARADVPALPVHWRARLATRQAEVWSRLAFARAQRASTDTARSAAQRAIDAIGRVDKTELVDDDLSRFHAAAVRVNAVRWAAAPAAALTGRLAITTRRADDGQSCVSLRDPKAKADAPALAERCSWGQVWAASAAPNREGTALALAVQPVDGWRELWVFRKDASGWNVQVLPPAALQPGTGYAEFAGWEPGGQRLLVAREAIAEGKTIRRFEVVNAATLTPERTALDAEALGPFSRWPDPAWKRDSLALR